MEIHIKGRTVLLLGIRQCRNRFGSKYLTAAYRLSAGRSLPGGSSGARKYIREKCTVVLFQRCGKHGHRQQRNRAGTCADSCADGPFQHGIPDAFKADAAERKLVSEHGLRIWKKYDGKQLLHAAYYAESFLSISRCRPLSTTEHKQEDLWVRS